MVQGGCFFLDMAFLSEKERRGRKAAIDLVSAYGFTSLAQPKRMACRVRHRVVTYRYYRNSDGVRPAVYLLVSLLQPD